ncbi:hypothetical protein RUM44_002502 [Polyplax serrata]|uniref:TMEM205-like domain-containing protein n=1 Tax=Polyplax serrata TaxID=468196 RepID=A0ABR1AEY8_POLSC
MTRKCCHVSPVKLQDVIEYLRELNCQESRKNDCAENAEVVEKDILSSSTQHLRYVFQLINIIYEKIKKTKFYSVLTSTTQPAHVAIMIVALVIVASLQSPQSTSTSNNILCKFIYVAMTAAHFGSQIWMTFASGLSLYFSLPRHHFGEVQKILFPLYFTLTSFFSLVTLLAHLHLVRSTDTTVILTACFLVEFVVRLYLCDPLVRLICIKNEMEAKHGLGMEVGKLSHESSLFSSTEYVSVHRRFRRLHMFIAVSNIVCIGFSTAHLYMTVSDVSFNQ